MSWSYGGDPGANQKDAVRFLVGDTVASDPLQQDEEITYQLASEPNAYYAAAMVCRSIAALFGRRVSKGVGSLRLGVEQVQHYLDLAKVYEVRGASSGLTVYAGGISVGDKDAQASNYGTVDTAPFFTRDMDENEGAGGTQESDLVDVTR